MKYSRSDVRGKATKVPQIKFQHNHNLTSFAGLVVFQAFFAAINLRQRLEPCFRHLNLGKIFAPAVLHLQLIVHILLGYRELRDCQYYADDPLVRRLLGLKRLPDAATLSRHLQQLDQKSVEHLQLLMQNMVIESLQPLGLARVTLDFDGSVQSTGRCAEGTAVGFNKQKKGARSYYPLFCTVAQTGQVLDLVHRSGNVHDSRGAREFILACISRVRKMLPYAQIEVRLDSAFFSDEVVSTLDAEGTQFSISVPFERLPALKQMIEDRRRWRRCGRDTSFFELMWKPKVWSHRFRFMVIRTKAKQQRKGPVQLDLFLPYEYGYEFKVVVTNKSVTAKKTVAFHNGRGSQEGIFAELKSHCHMGYVPVRTRVGNHAYLLAGLMAHNLTRQLQMQGSPPARKTTEKRAALWVFEKLDTLRKSVIRTAGRLTRPCGQLTLTINGGASLKQRLRQFFGGVAATLT